MIFRFLIVVDADEEKVAFVVVQCLTIVFVLDLLQGTFCTLVVFQFDHHGWDVGQVWDQY